MKVTNGGLLCRIRDHDHIIVRIITQFIGSGFPADRDRVRHSPEWPKVFKLRSVFMTQTFPGPHGFGSGKQVPPMSPTQSSVLLLAVNTPSGPEMSLSPVKPGTPCWGIA